jgi:hypothetical protein
LVESFKRSWIIEAVSFIGFQAKQGSDRPMQMLKLTLVFALLLSAPIYALDESGLLARWTFDEGKGEIARDSANGHEAQLSGLAWKAQQTGAALAFGGLGGSVDCGESKSLGIGGPITIEAWIKPTRKPNGEMVLFGEGYDSYVVTFYNTELCLFYIGSGGNNVSGKLALGTWNHLVATFDGTDLSMWINGREVMKRPSQFKQYEATRHFLIGTPNRPDLPKFKGAIDDLRVYNRALSGSEIAAHFKNEASAYGFDPTWFNRVRVTPYFYFDRGEVVVEADYRGLLPLDGKGGMQVVLARKDNPETPLQRQTLNTAPATGLAELKLNTKTLEAGEYVIEASLKDAKRSWPVERAAFSYPPKQTPLRAPSKSVVAPLPAPSTPTPFDFKLASGGGFELTLQGATYAFQTRISWPNGSFNRLTAGEAADSAGEKSWKVSTSTASLNRYSVDAKGASYSVHREMSVHPTHVYIKDTYTNATDQDLGLIIYNETPLTSERVKTSFISGHERLGRQPELGFPDYGPTAFFADDKAALGIVPIDDVFVVQAVPYVGWENAAGVGTERLALGPKQSYTLEWAVYPTGSKDYYDFINAFRTVEGRIGTVKEPPGFFTYGPNNRRQIPTQDFIEKRGMKIGVIHCLSQCADDPEISIEGIEFVDFPKEMQLLKDQASVFHKMHPDLKVVFHIAHSLYATNRPDRFNDSKVILPDGKQAIWGADDYISKQRQNEGWQWWIFYPTPGNKFHDALMRSVDVFMDDMGFDGVFLDGFLAGYISQWTYDRWDQHSVEIDLTSKTIKRKIGSVILLSQPSMIQFTRKIRDKGGIAIANNTVFTRSICNEKHILFDNECASGPQLHLAPTLTGLAAPPLENEREMYRDMLDKLSWGELFLYYQDRINLDYPSLASKQFPITFEEIRSGMVKGKERIVTMNSGVYGWRDDRRLHQIYKFDNRGTLCAHTFTTTIDSDSVRSELHLGTDESAVIEPIPVRIQSDLPVNVRVLNYDGQAFSALLNGNGPATLQMFVGTSYPDKRKGGPRDGGVNLVDLGIGNAYQVVVGSRSLTVQEKDGVLTVPITMDGEAEIRIAAQTGP